MGTFFRIAITGFFLIFVTNLHAEVFFGIGGSQVKVDVSSDQIEPINLSLRAGYVVNEHFEIGAELGTTLLSEALNQPNHCINITGIEDQAA